MDTSRPSSASTQGTLAYVAPERSRGDAVDHRADLYSLGAVLTELITGSPDASALPSELPPRLVSTLRRCLHPDPGQRFTDAGALAEELWKVAMVAPETAIVPSARGVDDPDRTVPMPRIGTVPLSVLEPGDGTDVTDDRHHGHRRRPGRVVAAIALAAMAMGAALVVGPTLASMNDGVTPHVKGPRRLPVPSELTASASCDGFMSTGVDLSWTPGPRGERASGYELWRCGNVR